jgi:hypothetical protein
VEVVPTPPATSPQCCSRVTFATNTRNAARELLVRESAHVPYQPVKSMTASAKSAMWLATKIIPAFMSVIAMSYLFDLHRSVALAT